MIFLVAADGVVAENIPPGENERPSDLFVVQVNSSDLNNSDIANSSNGFKVCVKFMKTVELSGFFDHKHGFLF